MCEGAREGGRGRERGEGEGELSSCAEQSEEDSPSGSRQKVCLSCYFKSVALKERIIEI